MIDVKELKLGNLVYVDNEQHHPSLASIPLEVTGISEATGIDNEDTFSISLKHVNQKQNQYYETYSQFLKYIRPISLTRALLERLPFNKYYESEWQVKYEHAEHTELSLLFKNGKVFFLKGDTHLMECQYLHKLQNIFYSLTNKELQLTPTP